MKKEFCMRVNNMSWTYNWTQGKNPIVCFSNPKVSSNIIYPLEELKVILARSDEQNRYVSVPHRVLQAAYDDRDVQASKAMAA